jgi:molybdopterin synthase catalytic subunit
VSLDTALTGDGELVLIPPVAGGAPTLDAVHLTDEVLGPAQVEALAALLSADDRGALVTFEGRVRNHARGREVTALSYEAYRPMALKQMRRIVAEIEAEYGVVCAIHHRLGAIPIGDNAVIAMAAHAHRGPAFSACARLIERLKEDVPIWKHETDPTGATWVSERP